jgi:hypothetical protein
MYGERSVDGGWPDYDRLTALLGKIFHTKKSAKKNGLNNITHKEK